MTIKEYAGGSKLTIRDVDTIHAGSYKCFAENIIGTKHVSGVITISPGKLEVYLRPFLFAAMQIAI